MKLIGSIKYRPVLFWLALLLSVIPSKSDAKTIATTASESSFSIGGGVYLNPNTGRFWSMDSYGGNNSDPETLHKYLYCKANPVTGVDPSGYGEDINILVACNLSQGMQATRAVGVMEGRKIALSKIEKIGMSIAASLLLMQEIGFGPNDIIGTIQTQTTQRANPTKSPYAYQNFECDAFASDAKAYFLKEGKQPQIINFYAYHFMIRNDQIKATVGLFAGLVISESGSHEGVLVDGEVYDNNFPFGVPRNTWESGYVVSPSSYSYGNYINLRQAHDEKYGIVTPP